MVSDDLMRAVLVDEGGGSNALRVGRVAIPRPGPEQILVRVRATALNNADLLQRDGLWPAPPGESEILGIEIAGDVVVPDAANRFRIGDAVFGLLGGGGYADYARMDAGLATLLPAGLSYGEGAALPEAAFVGATTLFELGELRCGERVLIHGGGSGMGSLAIQMAKMAGAWVACTVGADWKAERARALGADLAINRHQVSFVEAVKAATGGRGIDLVIDIAGADTLASNLEALADKGRLIQLGVMSGTNAAIDLDPILLKRLKVMGTIMRPLGLAEKRRIAERFRADWLSAVASGRIRAVVDSTPALADVAAAHERLAAGRHFGKIILNVHHAEAVMDAGLARAI
jgi:putative PIG3 family NAD(P)H quinone oxidoreductase